MVKQPFMGRHKTETWEDGKDTLTYDKVHVGQPNLVSEWQRISGDECGNACEPPRTFVAFGTTRDTAFMEQKVLESQPFCMTQLRTIPKVKQQISQIYDVLRSIPTMFFGDFLRTRFTSYHDTLQIAGSSFNTFSITSANTSPNLTTINLGSTANLPTSELTLQILEYYAQILGLRGYDTESGLPPGMRNLVTHSRVYQKLVGLNPTLQPYIRTADMGNLSPLYMPGKGINAEPFGRWAPTFDEAQLRFQTNGSGLLQRVLPYTNTTATTGSKPVYNPAWLNARYGISYILHPMAAILYTPSPSKIHPMVPSVNSAMFGEWVFKNPDGAIIWTNPDGTTCTKNNDLQFYFYWLCYLAAGFEYDQRDLVMPILHLLDGSGKDCVVDLPVCGDAPQYVAQTYTDNPILCET